MSSDSPIGIFDSGVGGLTVAREVFNLLPQEQVVYFGDVGRYPYGGRSNEIITKFARQDVAFLLEHDVKLIICACNSASAVALEEVSREISVPMIGVIEPGALAATKKTVNSRIGVVGTRATIGSNAYARVIHDINTELKIFSLACPLFVPLAEEGYIDKEATYQIARDYLRTMQDVDIDTLVLGCTHYPLLKEVISEVMGGNVILIDSGEEAAKSAYRMLKEMDLLAAAEDANTEKVRGVHKFFVSDVPEKFSQVATRFLGHIIDGITRVDISRY